MRKHYITFKVLKSYRWLMFILAIIGTATLIEFFQVDVARAIAPNNLTYAYLPTGTGIQFDGTQYIDTGVNQLGTISATIDYQYSATAAIAGRSVWLFGSRTIANSIPGDGLDSFRVGDGGLTFDSLTFDYGTTKYSILAPNTATRWTLTVSANGSNASATIIGTIVITGETAPVTGWPIFLGTMNTAGVADTRAFLGNIWSFAITKSGVSTLSYLPAANCTPTGAIYGFWDNETGTFHGPTAGNPFTTTPAITPPCAVVTFNLNSSGVSGGSLAPTTQGRVIGSTATNPAILVPSQAPTLPGYIFDGWYTDPGCTFSPTLGSTGCVTAWNFASPVTGNLTLRAKWIPIYLTATLPSSIVTIPFTGGVTGTLTATTTMTIDTNNPSGYTAYLTMDSADGYGGIGRGLGISSGGTGTATDNAFIIRHRDRRLS